VGDPTNWPPRRVAAEKVLAVAHPALTFSCLVMVQRDPVNWDVEMALSDEEIQKNVLAQFKYDQAG